MASMRAMGFWYYFHSVLCLLFIPYCVGTSSSWSCLCTWFAGVFFSCLRTSTCLCCLGLDPHLLLWAVWDAWYFLLPGVSFGALKTTMWLFCSWVFLFFCSRAACIVFWFTGIRCDRPSESPHLRFWRPSITACE